MTGGYLGGGLALVALAADILRNILSEEMRKFFKNANVGLAVSAVILAFGFWPTHRSEAAFTILGLTAFIAGMGVFITLNLRYERAQHRDPPHAR